MGFRNMKCDNCGKDARNDADLVQWKSVWLCGKCSVDISTREFETKKNKEELAR